MTEKEAVMREQARQAWVDAHSETDPCGIIVGVMLAILAVLYVALTCEIARL